jgi:hypothetical protein
MAKEFDFIKDSEDACIFKKVRGSAMTFPIPYVDDILIGNDVNFLMRIRTSLKIWFFDEGLGLDNLSNGHNNLWR